MQLLQYCPITFLPAVTALLSHHSSACSYCSTVTSQFCLQLLQFCHITILHAVTAVLSRHSSACSYYSTVPSQFCLQLLQHCHNPQSLSKQYVIFETNINQKNQRHFSMDNETLILTTESFWIVHTSIFHIQSHKSHLKCSFAKNDNNTFSIVLLFLL